MLVALALTAAVFWPGLSGGFLFDDYPNIVDNAGVQPQDASVSSLIGAALSSPSSEFKRPLASLSFAANYLAAGMSPYWMKLTNLVLHLLNGLLVFLLARSLLWAAGTKSLDTGQGATSDASAADAPKRTDRSQDLATDINTPATHRTQATRRGAIAALIAAGWMLLPINLTGVLYVVQRMESMANLFVLLGLIGYIAGRRYMGPGRPDLPMGSKPTALDGPARASRGFLLCVASIVTCTCVGALAKETAVMLPLYAALVEWLVFGFRSSNDQRDRHVIGLFIAVLLLPLVVGLAWLLPQVFNPGYWSTRDFTLSTRLYSEARIVADYVQWTLLPTPHALSFYHDNFRISQGLLQPWTTLASMVLLAAMVWLVLWLRSRRPLAALGVALFLACHLLTGTILPLELIYEHRNYFASFGLLLAVVPLLAARRGASLALPRQVLLGGLMLCWLSFTAFTAYAWGNPLRLAEDLASRAPASPRAQYELGRTYIIYSRYDPTSPFTRLAYAPLERSAALPESSILPEQALIFMNARMRLPVKDQWWDSLIAKLSTRKSTVQDESSLAALTQCAREHHCDLPPNRMIEAFTAALSRPDPSARLLAIYGDYAWNVLDDHALGLRMIEEAVKTSPGESAYRISLVRMLSANGQKQQAQAELESLKKLNVGGSLDSSIGQLQRSL